MRVGGRWGPGAASGRPLATDIDGGGSLGMPGATINVRSLAYRRSIPTDLGSATDLLRRHQVIEVPESRILKY